MRHRESAPSPLRTAIKAVLGAGAIERIRTRAAAADAERAMAALGIAQRAGIPVFLDADMHPRWTLERGAVRHRVFVTTIPKAGTYMMTKILPRLGVADCGVHVLRHNVVDNRFAPERLQRHHPSALGRAIAVCDAVRLIAPGQFAYGHIGLLDEQIRSAFAELKVVLMYRNLRDTYVSLVRFFHEIRHDVARMQRAALLLEDVAALLAWDMDHEGPYRLIGFKEICRWRHEPNVLSLRYEDVVGDHGRERQMEVMRELRSFLGSHVPDADLADTLDTAIGQPTLTRTNRRTVASEHWTEQVERMYRRIGFPDLNRELGYDEPE
jgi:hypothetical protein